MVITLLAGIWAVFFVILLENLACWRGENKMILEGAMRKGKGVSPLGRIGRNGSRRYQKWTIPGSPPSLPFTPLCGTEGSNSSCSSWRYCWQQSAERLHWECHRHSRMVSALKWQSPAFWHAIRREVISSQRQNAQSEEIFGRVPSARKPGEWFEFFQNCLKCSC